MADSWRQWPLRALGAMTAIALLLGLAEIYLRVFPPDYLHPFLGDDSPRAAHLCPDADFGVGFASWDALVAGNPGTLGPHSPLCPHSSAAAANTWLVLGTSFGFELAKRMPGEFPGHTILTLDRSEPLTVRLAQIKTLLESGCRPAHIFVVTTPIDFNTLGEFELCHHRANSRGGYVFEPHFAPEPFGAVLRHSRLAFSGWTRLRLHRDHPGFRMKQLTDRIPETMQRDQRQLFAGLARCEREHPVPITVLVLPGMNEIVQRGGFALQDTLIGILKTERLTYVDPRPALLAHAPARELFVPDGHFSDLGNHIVLETLRQQLARADRIAEARQGNAP
jgi:hypothetical protein